MRPKVYQPQLNMDAILDLPIDPNTGKMIDFDLPREVDYDFITSTFAPPPRPNALQRLWGRVGTMYKGIAESSKRRQLQVKELLQGKAREQPQQLQPIKDEKMKETEHDTQAPSQNQGLLLATQQTFSLVNNSNNTMASPQPLLANESPQPVTLAHLSVEDDSNNNKITSTFPSSKDNHTPTFTSSKDNHTPTFTSSKNSHTPTSPMTKTYKSHQPTYSSSLNYMDSNEATANSTAKTMSDNNQNATKPLRSILKAASNPNSNRNKSRGKKRKRVRFLLEVNDDDDKTPLGDSTNNNDSDTPPSKKKICRRINYNADNSHHPAINSVETQPPQMPYRCRNYMEPSRLLRCSDSDRDSKFSIKSANSKRKHSEIEDRNVDLEKQLINMESDQEGRTTKRTRTTFYMDKQTATQQFLLFTIRIICFLVLLVFMSMLYISYFNPHSRSYSHSHPHLHPRSQFLF